MFKLEIFCSNLKLSNKTKIKQRGLSTLSYFRDVRKLKFFFQAALKLQNHSEAINKKIMVSISFLKYKIPIHTLQKCQSPPVCLMLTVNSSETNPESQKRKQPLS